MKQILISKCWYEICTNTLDHDVNIVGDPVSAAINVACQPLVNFDVAELRSEETVFFSITNSNPGRRKLVKMHHLDPRTDEIHITKCDLIEIDSENSAVTLSLEGSRALLRLEPLIRVIDDVLPLLYKWSVVRANSANTLRLALPAPSSCPAEVENVCPLPVAPGALVNSTSYISGAASSSNVLALQPTSSNVDTLAIIKQIREKKPWRS